MTALLIAIAVLSIAFSTVFFRWRHERRNWIGIREYERERAEKFATKFREVDQREARFRQALGYYADEETWAAPGRQHSPAFKDRGRIAREALK